MDGRGGSRGDSGNSKIAKALRRASYPWSAQSAILRPLLVPLPFAVSHPQHDCISPRTPSQQFHVHTHPVHRRLGVEFHTAPPSPPDRASNGGIKGWYGMQACFQQRQESFIFTAERADGAVLTW